MRIIIILFISILVLLTGCAGLDPNEANVDDGNDFKHGAVRLSGPNVIVEVVFYANYNGSGFTLNFDHNNDGTIDHQVSCGPNQFGVIRRSTTAPFTLSTFIGTPSINANRYNAEFPLTALNLAPGATTNYWFVRASYGRPGGFDIYPDSGKIALTLN